MRLIVGDIYQGRKSYALKKYGEDSKIYTGLLDRIKELDYSMSMNTIIDTILGEILPYDIVIAEEAFSGLTPIDEKERLLTEVYGRTLNEIAARAESVERVVCGLGISLK